MDTDESTGEKPLLVAGDTCWRSAEADRFAAIADGAEYLRHLKAAMLCARHRIVVVGWDLDYRTAFERDETSLDGPNQLGLFLHWLLWKRRGLNVYLLKSNLQLLPAFDRFWFGVAPVSLLNQFTSARLHFAVDGAHPGAVHHQKIVVIDDALAFCGGLDLTLGRWDTSEHRRADPRRSGPGGAYGPRHEGDRCGGRTAANPRCWTVIWASRSSRFQPVSDTMQSSSIPCSTGCAGRSGIRRH